ncbi:hypothetical protein BC936DRAFT_143479 [Jimgerdemannia flammicorona]|uniref:DUF711 family protein n=1 Tax=Jimgerdemannia flammicorona TaxID=994334 RepID=A0A433DDT0_9FUNG|nr:hypothetical protein BC936DRAFT_143479 [Jimgerdemannia flammicorona]
MRIRTLTTFVSLPPANDPNHLVDWDRILRKAAAFNLHGKAHLEQVGYEVQTTRITTNPFPEFTSAEESVKNCKILDGICANAKVNLLSVGPTSDPDYIKRIPEIMEATKYISYSVAIPRRPNGVIDLKTATHAAAAILAISCIESTGAANFRFCATANITPGIPFFPVGYSLSYDQGGERDQISFALGLECSDLVVRAFGGAREEWEGVDNGDDEGESVLDVAERWLKYDGIDVSIAPACGLDGLADSIAIAYERLGLGGFGANGTLAVSGLVTGVIKSLDIKKCGYSGLMLPIMEDAGLAERFGRRAFSVQEVLLYSSVCGCGLDCIPIVGDTPVKPLANLLADMATLAFKLNKPLSARIFPIPGTVAGDLTCFDDPLLVNTQVVGLV